MIKEQKIFLSALIIILGALLLFIFLPFSQALIFGFLIALIFYPIHKRILFNLNGKENLSAFLSTIIIILIIFIPLSFLTLMLVKESFSVSSKISSGDWRAGINLLAEGKDVTTNFLDKNLNLFNLNVSSFIDKGLGETIHKLSSFLYSSFYNIISNIPSLVIGFFITIFSIFYLLRDGRKLKDFLIKLSPLDTEDEIFIFKKIKDVGRALFYGNIIAAGFQGLLGGLGFLIFGIGSPVLWGTVMAFLALIPFVGPFIIFIPAAIILFFSKGLIITLIFLAYNLLIVSTVDNLIKPFLVGGRLKTSSFMVLLSILGGLSIFGIEGIIYGPITLVVFIALAHVYINKHETI